MIDGAFTVAQFYVDADGHIDDEAMRFAFEELKFYTSDLKVLGVYPASPFRRTGKV